MEYKKPQLYGLNGPAMGQSRGCTNGQSATQAHCQTGPGPNFNDCAAGDNGAAVDTCGDGFGARLNCQTGDSPVVPEVCELGGEPTGVSCGMGDNAEGGYCHPGVTAAHCVSGT